MDNLTFHLERVYPSEGREGKETCYLEAEAWLAGQKWKGRFSYATKEQATCWQMELVLETDLSLGSLMGQIFESGHRPASLFDLEILGGSGLSCAMSDDPLETGEIQSRTWSLNLHTMLTFVVSIELWGEVRISSETFAFSLQAGQPLDLEILQLGGLQGEKGPAFVYQYQKGDKTQKKSLEAQGEISFFGQSLVEGKFWYSGGKDDWRVRAELSLEGALQTVFGERLTVIYDKKTGFRLEDLDTLSYAGEAFDFLKRMMAYLELLGKNNGCEKLSEEADKKVLKTHWEIRPGLEGVSGDGNRDIRLTLKGRFRVEDQSKKILLERQIGADSSLGITLSRQMTGSDLWKEIGDLLGKTADQIVKALFEKENFKELEAILTALAQKELESFVAGLLCRKLISQEQADRLLPEKPSGEGSDSGGGETGGGESGGAGASETGFSTFAVDGGTAFSFGETGDWMVTDFAGVAVILMFPPGGEKSNPDKPLPCPRFRGTLDGSRIKMEIWQVEGAAGYEIDLMWNGSGREDCFLSWKEQEDPPQISLLEIPVNGDVFGLFMRRKRETVLGVRAIIWEM